MCFALEAKRSKISLCSSHDFRRAETWANLKLGLINRRCWRALVLTGRRLLATSLGNRRYLIVERALFILRYFPLCFRFSYWSAYTCTHNPALAAEKPSEFNRKVLNTCENSAYKKESERRINKENFPWKELFCFVGIKLGGAGSPGSL
jgi:hypothetical protein